jgi:hypothetical protein
MTASERPPRDPAETHTDDRPVRYDDPFWTDARRAAFRDVVRRVGSAILLALLACAWGVFAILWLLNRALTGGPDPSAVGWIALLLPGVLLFALSVWRLVERRAPPMLRILGIIYAILGAVAILSLLEAG